MYYMLIPFADRAGFSQESLKAQLECEYCTRLQELPISWNTVVASRVVVAEDINKVRIHPFFCGVDKVLRVAKQDSPDTHQLHEGVQLEDLHAVFPGALDAENTGQVAPRTTADRVFCASIYCALFAFVSLGFMLLAIKFLLKHPLLVFCISPFLGNLFRALSDIFRFAHDWAWHE